MKSCTYVLALVHFVNNKRWLLSKSAPSAGAQDAPTCRSSAALFHFIIPFFPTGGENFWLVLLMPLATT